MCFYPARMSNPHAISWRSRPLLVCAAMASALLAMPSSSAAQATVIHEAPPAAAREEAHASSAPGLGLLLGAGLHTGLALGARLGIGDFGVEASGGYQLLLAVFEDDARQGHIKAGSSAQLAAELYATPWHPLPSSAIGLKAGWRYNSVLKQGFSVAISVLADITPHLAFEGLVGASIFPGSEGRLRRKLGVPSTGDITYGSSTQFFEYGVELIWYP